MSATLTKQFESFAECCLDLARSAATTERRARFTQMADEYRLATLLISEERKSRDFYHPQRRVTSSRLLLKHPPPLRCPDCPVARGPGFKAQMFGADKQNPNL
jgi:hypothetical protein